MTDRDTSVPPCERIGDAHVVAARGEAIVAIGALDPKAVCAMSVLTRRDDAQYRSAREPSVIGTCVPSEPNVTVNAD